MQAADIDMKDASTPVKGEDAMDTDNDTPTQDVEEAATGKKAAGRGRKAKAPARGRGRGRGARGRGRKVIKDQPPCACLCMQYARPKSGQR